MSVAIRYQIEQVERGWIVWRRVKAGSPRAVGGTRGTHGDKREAERTIETQRRADLAAATRLETEVAIEILPVSFR